MVGWWGCGGWLLGVWWSSVVLCTVFPVGRRCAQGMILWSTPPPSIDRPIRSCSGKGCTMVKPLPLPFLALSFFRPRPHSFSVSLLPISLHLPPVLITLPSPSSIHFHPKSVPAAALSALSFIGIINRSSRQMATLSARTRGCLPVDHLSVCLYLSLALALHTSVCLSVCLSVCCFSVSLCLSFCVVLSLSSLSSYHALYFLGSSVYGICLCPIFLLLSLSLSLSLFQFLCLFICL